MQEEEWRVVQDYPAYAVSSLGKVKRIRSGRGARAEKILTPRPSPKGYLRVALHNEHGRRDKQIHVVVAQVFLDPAAAGYEVNHRDGNKQNNTAGSLEWVTPSENMYHAIALGLIHRPKGEANPRALLTEEEVATILSLRGKVTYKTLAYRYGVTKATINRIFEGKTWTHIPQSAPPPLEEELIPCGMCEKPTPKLRNNRPVKYCSPACIQEARRKRQAH